MKLIPSPFVVGLIISVVTCESSSRKLSPSRCGAEHPWKRVPWYSKLHGEPIRGVNIGGLFVLESWITPALTSWSIKPVREGTNIVDQYSFSLYCHMNDSCHILKDHWNHFYSAEDFLEMKKLNLNTVRLPVGYWYFTELSGFPSSPFILPEESILSSDHPITRVIGWAKQAGLQVLLDLHGAPGSQNGFDNSGMQAPLGQPDSEWGTGWLQSSANVKGTVDTARALAEYVSHIEKEFGLDNVMAIELLNEPYVSLDLDAVRSFYLDAMDAVRGRHASIPLFLHDSFRLDQWDYLLDEIPHRHVFMDNHNYFAFYYQRQGDVEEDKWKQEMYSDMACKMTQTLKHSSCASAPVMVGEWSLAIDNCMPRLDMRFEDVGQCAYVPQRLDDPWWQAHVHDFAMRQIYVYEQNLGWVFWTWKLDDHASLHPSAPYWSFRLAVEKGYIDTTAYGSPACVFETVQGPEDQSPDTSQDSPEPSTVTPEGEEESESDQQLLQTRSPPTPVELPWVGRLSFVAGGLLSVTALWLVLELVKTHRKRRSYSAVPTSTGCMVSLPHTAPNVLPVTVSDGRYSSSNSNSNSNSNSRTRDPSKGVEPVRIPSVLVSVEDGVELSGFQLDNRCTASRRTDPDPIAFTTSMGRRDPLR